MERDPRESLWPGLKEEAGHPTYQPTGQGRGRGQLQVSVRTGKLPLPTPWPGTAPTLCRTLQTQDWVVPRRSQPRPPGLQGFPEPRLGWAKQCLLARALGALESSSPIPPRKTRLLPKEEERPVDRLALKTGKWKGLPSAWQPNEEGLGQRWGQGRQGGAQTSFPGQGQGREPLGGQRYPLT